MMLHAAIRGLHNLSGLENLQVFSDKYFGNAVENRNPTLMEVLRFEEEILRQKITWVEKYDGAMDAWVTSKITKDRGRKYNYGNSSETLADSGQPVTGGSTATEASTASVTTGAEPDAKTTETGASAESPPVPTPTETDTSTPVPTATTAESDASSAVPASSPDGLNGSAPTTDATDASAVPKTVEPGEFAVTKTIEPAVATTEPDASTNVGAAKTTESDATVKTTGSDMSAQTTATDPAGPNAPAAAASPSVPPAATTITTKAETEKSVDPNENNIPMQRLNNKRNKKRDREEAGGT